jgi:hypothetical protein
MATTRQKALDVAGKMLPPDLMERLGPGSRAPFGAELGELGLALMDPRGYRFANPQPHHRGDVDCPAGA